MEKFSTNELKSDPYAYSNKIPIYLLVLFIRKANKYYFEKPKLLISDYTYDIIIDVLRERDPKNKLFTEIGQTPISDDKVQLPFHMGSMTKLKTKEPIEKWIKKYKGPYIISEKLDGASALIICKNGKYTIYSRGDGKIGRDITHIEKFIDLPKMETDIILRGELIISKETFETYKDTRTNARSMINGIVNTKKKKTNIKIDYVVFEVIDIENKLNISSQLKLALDYGFKVCHHEIVNDISNLEPLSDSLLFHKLKEFKSDSKYDIDGIIIGDLNLHEKNSSGNPDYCFAFKSNTLGNIAKVLDIEWNISKHGKIVPTVKFTPTIIDNVTISYATGKHAKFIIENGIGKNALIRIVRSGDVIPDIIDIIEKGDEPNMPTINYKWNETKVNIYIVEESDTINYHRLLNFFKSLNVKNLSSGLIKKFIKNDYNTIKKICLITKQDLLKMDGIKETMANKLYNNIHSVIDKPILLEILMKASLCFGESFGIRRLKLIVVNYPKLLKTKISEEDIIKIDGFSNLTAKKFIDKLEDFREFLKENDFLTLNKPKKKLKINGKYSDKSFVFTGGKDDNVRNYIKINGGTISEKVNTKTHLLIVKDIQKTSTKLVDAKKHNVNYISLEEFRINNKI